MSQVEFDTDTKGSVLYSKFQPSNEVPTLVRWLMSFGLAKTAGQANAILLGIAVAAFVVSGFLIYKMNSGTTTKGLGPTAEQLQEFRAR